MKIYSIFASLLLIISLLIKLSAPVILYNATMHSEEPHIHEEYEHKRMTFKTITTQEPLTH